MTAAATFRFIRDASSPTVECTGCGARLSITTEGARWTLRSPRDVADRVAIRAAYHSLARRYHPDLEAGSEAQMAALDRAWAVLRDPAARAAYDRERVAPSPVPVEPSATTTRSAPASTTRGPSGSSVLDFGRYAGWSLSDLRAMTPNYLLWFERMRIGRRFRAEIDRLLAPAPTSTVTRSASSSKSAGRRRRWAWLR